MRRRVDLAGTEREVHAPTWVSRRYLLKQDGMGFSFHETILPGGRETRMWYKNHLEAVYCVEGEGELEDLATGERHRIDPGTMYALNANDRHVMRTITDMRLICVFNPPCVGPEVHDADGSFPLLEETARG
ncbi:MAG: ectoine synthase [Candidatus Hydrogenedentales bacterium]